MQPERGPRSASSTDLWSAYVESHVAAGLNMEEEEKEEEKGEVEAKAEKGPTHEVSLAHKNKTHQSEAVACETVPCGLLQKWHMKEKPYREN